MERFKEIPGHPGYKISNLGNVMGKEGNILKKWIMKKVNKTNTQYYYVHLNIPCEAWTYMNKVGKPEIRHSKTKTFRVTSLMWLTFRKPYSYPMQIDHKNGNSFDDRLVNLRLLNQSANIIIGYMNNKNRSKRSGPKLSYETYSKIYQMWSEGISQIKIGRELGIHNSSVSKIVSGKRQCFYNQDGTKRSVCHDNSHFSTCC